MDSYLRDILSHLGTQTLDLIGAKEITPKEDTERSVSFRIRDNEHQISHIKIIYEKAYDLYTVCFFTESSNQLIEKEKVDEVYASELHEVISKHTGLQTKEEHEPKPQEKLSIFKTFIYLNFKDKKDLTAFKKLLSDMHKTEKIFQQPYFERWKGQKFLSEHELILHFNCLSLEEAKDCETNIFNFINAEKIDLWAGYVQVDKITPNLYTKRFGNWQEIPEEFLRS